ncbi:MAG: hypothetical protein V3U97_05215 [bacterium]
MEQEKEEEERKEKKKEEEKIPGVGAVEEVVDMAEGLIGKIDSSISGIIFGGTDEKKKETSNNG